MYLTLFPWLSAIIIITGTHSKYTYTHPFHSEADVTHLNNILNFPNQILKFIYNLL